MILDDQQPACSSSGVAGWELFDGSSSPWSCVPLFSTGQRVNRFRAIIIMPVQGMAAFQVGVVTSPKVKCEDPAMVVMIESGDNVRQTKPRHQCARERQYDTMKNNSVKTCVFECTNHWLTDLKIIGTVQVNKLPLFNNDHLKICEIEAYSFWEP